MWLIRNAQLAVFDKEALRQAILSMRVHVRTHFKELLREVPDERLFAVLSRVVGDARAQGLVRLSEVLLYVNLSMVFGEGFLDRTELPWMREIMNEAGSAPRDRIRKLHAEAVKRMEARS